jgi:hypothetical protein
MRPRPAEIRDDAIALVLRDIAIVTPNDPRDGLMIGLYDMVIFLGIEAGGSWVELTRSAKSTVK